VRQNIRLWFGPGLASGKVLFPRSSSDFSWREAMQKPERNRRAHRRQSAPRFDVTASRLDALKPGQPARFSFFIAAGHKTSDWFPRATVYWVGKGTRSLVPLGSATLSSERPFCREEAAFLDRNDQPQGPCRGLTARKQVGLESRRGRSLRSVMEQPAHSGSVLLGMSWLRATRQRLRELPFQLTTHWSNRTCG